MGAERRFGAVNGTAQNTCSSDFPELELCAISRSPDSSYLEWLDDPRYGKVLRKIVEVLPVFRIFDLMTQAELSLPEDT